MEQVAVIYATNCHVGAVVKGVLIPMEQKDQGPSRKRPAKQPDPQEDEGFSPYRTTDAMGNTKEMGEQSSNQHRGKNVDFIKQSWSLAILIFAWYQLLCIGRLVRKTTVYVHLGGSPSFARLTHCLSRQ